MHSDVQSSGEVANKRAIDIVPKCRGAIWLVVLRVDHWNRVLCNTVSNGGSYASGYVLS